MKAKALFAVALMFAMVFVAAVPVETDDAAVTNVYIEGGNNITVDKDKGTTITVHYTADKNDTCTVSLYISTSKTPLWSESMVFDVTEDGTFQIPLDTASYPNGAAQMKITFSNNLYSDISFTVNYNTSIWSQWTTYAVIIVIILLIVALVVYKSRTAPKVKNQLTFEQVEAMKQAEKNNQTATEKKAPVKSERQRYLASKKK